MYLGKPVSGFPDFYKKVLYAILDKVFVAGDPSAVPAKVVEVLVVKVGEGNFITFDQVVPHLFGINLPNPVTGIMRRRITQNASTKVKND